MPQVQEVWGKLNANERLAAYGGIVLVLVSLVGFALRWRSGPTLGLIAGIVVLAILYVKYAPTVNVSWPVPVATILLAVGAVTTVLMVLEGVGNLSFIVGVHAIVLVGLPAGAALVAWGAWQEYQAAAKPAGGSGAPPAA